MTLFRPVGQPELDLIMASGSRRFPPRLDWQPIFYPVLSEDYARTIARDWNVRDDGNGNVGYVTRFEIDQGHFNAFEVHTVGGRDLRELWVRAEDLEEFNEHLLGPIEVIAEYRPTPTSNDFHCVVSSVFTITGRGLVAAGSTDRGTYPVKGSLVRVWHKGVPTDTLCHGIGDMRVVPPTSPATAGLLLTDLTPDQVAEGDIITEAPSTA